MKKKQFLKFCFGWMPTGAMMLCTMTMLTAGPLLPQASAAIEQNAKSSQVTGMVTDGQKQPLIGVTITLVGTDVHALTDIDGMFHIDVPSGNKNVLEFNYIGFKKKQVNVNGSMLLNVMLEEETSEFEEVVVTGYSSQKKASIIGSIETIQPGELQFGTTRTLSNNLAGKLLYTVEPGAGPEPVPGDVNGDGEVTGSDVTALYNHILFGQDTDIFNGDQNGDGEVTGSDVTAVYNIILGL